MIPYGGPVFRPPVQRVDPPSPRERRQTLRLLLLCAMFAAGLYLLLVGFGEDGFNESFVQSYQHYLASMGFFAAWLAVKMCWKKE
jgi:hypothetical protein